MRAKGGAELYDLPARRPVQAFADFKLPGSASAFSPDGRWLAYGTTNYGIRIWDLALQCEQASCRGNRWWVYALRFSPDSKLLASGAWDGSVWLWSVKTGTPLHPPLKGHQSAVIPIAFSADGKTLITGADDRTIRWWNVTLGKEMLLFPNAFIISRYLKSEAEVNPGGDVVAWEEFRGPTIKSNNGPVHVMELPSLAQIEAREKARSQSPLR